MPEEKPKRFSADEIIRSTTWMHEALWSLWQRERMLTSFFNSGPLPTDDDECGDDAPVSLGLGYRFVKKGLEALLDVIVTKPGFVKTEVCYPLVAKRQFMVSNACDKEINAIVQPRMQSLMTSLCGRAMITGRGAGTRIFLRSKGLFGTITGSTGRWHQIDFDCGVDPFGCNYYGAWEFDVTYDNYNQ